MLHINGGQHVIRPSQGGQVIRFPTAGRKAARPVLAASVAVFRDGKVLLATLHQPPADQPWSLPGGKVEAGETLEQAALRELEEEVGVKRRAFSASTAMSRSSAAMPAGSVTHHFVIASFVGEWLSGEPQPGPGGRRRDVGRSAETRRLRDDARTR